MFIIDSLIQYSSAPKDEQLRDLANLGLRTVIREIQPATALSKAASTGKMVPKLTEQLNNKSATPDMLLNAAELLHDLFARFESEWVFHLSQLAHHLLTVHIQHSAYG